MAVGASIRVHQGLLPTANDWLRALVRETKYGVYEAAGVALSMAVRQLAPGRLMVAQKPRGRSQLDSQRSRAAISGNLVAMAWVSGWGAGDWQGAKKRRWAGGREAGPILTGAPTILATCWGEGCLPTLGLALPP